MNCDRVQHFLLERDRDERAPAAVADHLSRCEACRSLAQDLHRAELAIAPRQKADPRLVDAIMAAVETAEAGAIETAAPAAEAAESESPAPVAWILGGIILLASMLSVSFSASFLYLLESAIGHSVDLAVTVVFGCVLVAYLGAFVARNAGYLKGLLPNDGGGASK
jgi:predicted anti-sigma-YlaC factor YlaD